MRAHNRRFSVSKAVFNRISSNSLIYNTSWEDPRVDLGLLDIGSDSRVLKIGGAGCNVLNYLLKSPESITAIDQNPYQCALLAIKAQLIRHGEYDLLRSLFMQGRTNPELLSDISKLINELPEPGLKKYSHSLSNFFSSGRSFYYRGSAGFVARMIREKIIKGSLENSIYELFESNDITTQKNIYTEKVEHLLFGKKLVKYLSSDSAMSMLGVPDTQLTSIKKKYPKGIFGFIKEKLRHVFTSIPAKENYFWQVYFFGGYVYSAPDYLKEDNFSILQKNINSLEILKGDIYNTDYNKVSDKIGEGYTHVNLLDSLDWFSDNARDSVAFPNIAHYTSHSAKILFRSSHFDISSLKSSVYGKFEIQSDGDGGKVATHHLKDRVGTYSSLHLAEKL